MNWVLYFTDNGYEVWFMKTRLNPDKYVRIRFYSDGLSKAVEMELEKKFLSAEDELIKIYIKNAWQNHHNEEMIK